MADPSKWLGRPEGPPPDGESGSHRFEGHSNPHWSAMSALAPARWEGFRTRLPSRVAWRRIPCAAWRSTRNARRAREPTRARRSTSAPPDAWRRSTRTPTDTGTSTSACGEGSPEAGVALLVRLRVAEWAIPVRTHRKLLLDAVHRNHYPLGSI